jgi:hypothetical protein
MWTDICPRIFILEVPDAISNSSCGVCEEHEGEKSKITLQWGPLTKRHFIRISFGCKNLGLAEGRTEFLT